jgi:hypothetical protein
MLLRRNPNPRTIFRIASLFLLAFFALPLVARPTATFWVDVLDGVRGAMLGVTLGLFALSAMVKRRRSGNGDAPQMSGR